MNNQIYNQFSKFYELIQYQILRDDSKFSVHKIK